MTQRDWQNDMEFILREKERVQLFKLPTKEEDIAIYWLQEAKERGERERQLKEAIEEALKWTWYHGEANMVEIDTVLNDILATLYPDTPAPKEGE
ncbi:hypothetical protein [Paenibacillus odorifer]|uniref:hypothetical protein n=1 Tax=Paenibacillus TaxID=44249 RepID=UPI00096D39B6|nr:hypothetical protein [Paenibacillus odorifer]OMD00880.1 hypothetical protein BJP46_18805 [Paenibacillus odorifer]